MSDNHFLLEECTLGILTQDVLDTSYPFTCGNDEDMDEFFRDDAVDYTYFKMGKSYCFRLDADPKQIIACFTVSNDSLRIYDLPSSRKKAMWDITNREKMLSRYPGVLIGRLAVNIDLLDVESVLRYWTLSKCGLMHRITRRHVAL